MRASPAFHSIRAPEAKYVDQFGVAVTDIVLPDPTAGYTVTRLLGFNIAAINLCQEGAANYNRLGRRIKMKSIQITGTFIPRIMSPLTPVTQEKPIFCRFAVVYDRQPVPGGTYPTATDIWLTRNQSGTPNGTGAAWPWSPPNVDNIDRFQVCCHITGGRSSYTKHRHTLRSESE